MKKILLVIEREFFIRVKKKSFIITTILMPVLFAGMIALPGVLASVKSETEKKILVLDQTGVFGEKIKNFGKTTFQVASQSLDELKNQLESDKNYAILYIGKSDNDNLLGDVNLYSKKIVGMDMVSNIKMQLTMIAAEVKLRQYDIENVNEVIAALKPNYDIKTIRLGEGGDEAESHTGALMGLAMICGMLIFFVIFFFGIQIMRGVIEEKSNRIIEVIISSIKPIQLMLGKIIGVALVVIIQLVIWLILILAIFFVAQTQFADVVSKITSYVQDVPVFTMTACFFIYLVLGYLLYAAMFAAVGSAVDNETDTQQLQMIVTIPLFVGYLMMINVATNPDSPLAFWGSMIPFTSPVVMLARIPYGVSPLEIVVSILILFATFILLTKLAARIYRVGILMYGKKVSFKEMIKWIKYKN